jgi:hypothetical protein
VTVSGAPDPALIEPPSCRSRPPARLHHSPSLSGMALPHWPHFRTSAVPGRFYRPVSLPTIYKTPTSLPSKPRRTFTSFSPSPFLLSPPWTRCNAVSLVQCTAPFHSTADAAPSANQPVLASGDIKGFIPSVLGCLRSQPI